jgi:hypothetical protein
MERKPSGHIMPWSYFAAMSVPKSGVFSTVLSSVSLALALPGAHPSRAELPLGQFAEAVSTKSACAGRRFRLCVCDFNRSENVSSGFFSSNT